MSSAVVSTSAAQSRLFIFDDESAPEICQESTSSRAVLDRTAEGGCPYIIQALQPKIRNQKSAIHLSSASHLTIRPAPEMVPSGITALDALTGGLPRGCITEICGPASSGRTSVLVAALAAATGRGEYCALIDATDALDPHSLAAADVNLDRLLWVRCGTDSPSKHAPSPSSVILSAAKDRLQNGDGSGPSRNFYSCSAGSELFGGTNRHCSEKKLNNRIQSSARQSEHRLEQVLRATDLLLESGGFGLIALDLADVPPESARRIPLTTWFRFRRAIEHTPTILLVIEPQPIAGSCSSLVLQLGVLSTQYPVPSSKPSHSHLLTGLEITVELIRSRFDRKPACSVAFETRTAWAG